MAPASKTLLQHGAGAVPGGGRPQTLQQQQYYMGQYQSGNPAVFPFPPPLANLAYHAQQGIPMQRMAPAGIQGGYPTMMAGGGQMQVRRTQNRAVYSILPLFKKYKKKSTTSSHVFPLMLSNIFVPPLSPSVIILTPAPNDWNNCTVQRHNNTALCVTKQH